MATALRPFSCAFIHSPESPRSATLIAFRATSAKANLITLVTGISHTKLKVALSEKESPSTSFKPSFPWFYSCCSTAGLAGPCLYTFSFIVYYIWNGNMMELWKPDVFYWSGVAVLILQVYLNMMSIGLRLDSTPEFGMLSKYLIYSSIEYDTMNSSSTLTFSSLSCLILDRGSS